MSAELCLLLPAPEDTRKSVLHAHLLGLLVLSDQPEDLFPHFCVQPSLASLDTLPSDCSRR